MRRHSATQKAAAPPGFLPLCPRVSDSESMPLDASQGLCDDTRSGVVAAAAKVVLVFSLNNSCHRSPATAVVVSVNDTEQASSRCKHSYGGLS
mmetsp:Transcript_90029/g.173270  ORF Transcript_90029/g.173270 Transcript_90029/m.173270 type:complete len:93 (-) Transcript_90029:334-612(-)